MTHCLTICLAGLRCHWYLLTQGMWRGECRFCGWDHSGRIIFISAATGTIEGMIGCAAGFEIKRVFYWEKK